MELNEVFKGFKVEEFIPYKINHNITEFDLDKNALIFFDSVCEENYHLANYIGSDLDYLKSLFAECGKNFINLSKLKSPGLIFDDIITFYFPRIETQYFKEFSFLNENSKNPLNEFLELAEVYLGNTIKEPKPNPNITKQVLDYLGYTGNTQTGFLFFNNDKACVIECEDLHFFNLNLQPFKKLLEYFTFQKQVLDEELSNYHFSPREFSHKVNPYENLDEDTIVKIHEIQNQLNDLKESGQILFALPILKSLVTDFANKIQIDSLSNIRITAEFNIILPDFNDLEISMSHLTKVVYLLFHNHPEGINIKRLGIYKSELKDLYSKISNQSNYNKMMNSIEDLIDPNSKSIYTHISRVKSAFYKKMDKQYANHYIITSDDFGRDIKKIPIIEQQLF
ncbi:hypothetical protein [Flavobacterium agrisoli]|uniref:Uncharacterized protein n=1 Tax=Flavobacterium agrisoli TaxID=2793066 RepID=A0A934PNR9_9FLAO|nr:hypothetical protein [Flavobacterium agrisoli]MBK0369808.1 hypothetical protein [Flavobacterium agrisoli]